MERERQFPLLEGSHNKPDYSIPWELIAPHEKQAIKNHGQTLERLAERHGLSFCEAVAIIEDRPWKHMNNAWVTLAHYVMKYRMEQKKKEQI